MQYRIDPQSGNQLSVLGFGLMRLPRGITGIDQEQTTALLKQAVQAGVNYFDTAYVYAGSEQVFGKALQATGLRDSLYLATKLPHQMVRSAADLDRIFEEQLKRLQTERIDYYLIHNLPDLVSWQRLVGLGIEEWISKKKASGQISQIGFSFHGKQNDFLELLDAYAWQFCQIQYNYLDVNYQAGMTGLKAAQQKGLMVVIMEPLRGGKLATGLPAAAAAVLKTADGDASLAAWAFNWIWNQAEPTVVLSGMNSAEQLAENMATANQASVGLLSPDQHKALEQVIQIIQKSYRIPCTSCSYCMPCPHGVNIPDCFNAYNTRYSQGLVSGYTQYFSGIRPHQPERYSGPSKCQACGACERKCPQNLAIIDSLLEVRKHMEAAWTRPLIAVIGKII